MSYSTGNPKKLRMVKRKDMGAVPVLFFGVYRNTVVKREMKEKILFTI